MERYDLLVASGGINGVGLAHEAAEGGLSVVLAQQDDLGTCTSSASSKLVHGGLRDLERGGLPRRSPSAKCSHARLLISCGRCAS